MMLVLSFLWLAMGLWNGPEPVMAELSAFYAFKAKTVAWHRPLPVTTFPSLLDYPWTENTRWKYFYYYVHWLSTWADCSFVWLCFFPVVDAQALLMLEEDWLSCSPCFALLLV